MTERTLQRAVASLFNWQRNIIVPNVGYGMNIHECDLLIVTKSGYATEVECKVTVADMKADLKKPHGHRSGKIKRLFYAFPVAIEEKCTVLVPEGAGIIVLVAGGWAEVRRSAPVNRSARCFSPDEMLHLAHLGTMRIWEMMRVLDNVNAEMERFKKETVWVGAT